MNLTNPDHDPLDLDNIRTTLVRLEDTIIFSMIERALFSQNTCVYEKNAFKELGHDGNSQDECFLEWMLHECEQSHAKVRRYESPDEYPFTARELLPASLLPPIKYPKLLHPNLVNVNHKIYSFYTENIIPAISRPGDDGNYGSSATRDMEALQAISRRIHYGKFVSESKFRSAPHSFVPHILSPNPSALDALITKPAVEAALLRRLKQKALLYGQELDAAGKPVETHPEGKRKIDAEEVVKMYEKHVIPLTKEVEVEYLLRRLDGVSPEEIERLAKPPTPV